MLDYLTAWALSSAGSERLLHTQEVTGSSPVEPTGARVIPLYGIVPAEEVLKKLDSKKLFFKYFNSMENDNMTQTEGIGRL